MKIEVILLSGTLRLSGSTTWINGLAVGFAGVGINFAHVITGQSGDLSPRAEQVYYTGRSRSNLTIRILRWLQVHKLFKEFFVRIEARVFSSRVQALLKGKLAERVLVIKDFTSLLPECFADKKFVVIDVLHQQFTSLQQGGYRDHLLTVSSSVMEASSALGFEIEKVILNPLDKPALQEQASLYHPSIETPYILFVGSLNDEKGVFDLLEAFSQLCDKALSGYSLVYVGEGRDRDALLSQACRLGVQERVYLTGFLENPYPWIRHSRLLVLPSRSEAMPYVPIEASALGTPYLVADFNSAKEFFPPGNIFSASDSENRDYQLKTMIDKIISQPASHVFLVEGLAEKIQPEKIALQYYQFLQQGERS